MIAIVRVRGRFGLKPKIKRTLELLKLHKPNHCVIYNDTPSIRGMLKVIEDYVAYGEIDEKTLISLIKTRSNLNPEETIKIIKNGGKINYVFRLHPPRKGWGSIKQRYPKGALGRRDDMDELLKRMM